MGTLTFYPGVTNFKNKLINGDFSIWQRGTSGINQTNATYTADRWIVLSDVPDLIFNWQRIINDGDILGAGFSYGLKIQKVSGTGIIEATQFIEDVTQFQPGEKVTVSFWAKTTTTTTPYDISVVLQGSILRFTETTTENITAAGQVSTTFKRFSATLTVPDWTLLTTLDFNKLEDTALVCKIRITNPNVTDDLIITGIQLERGQSATSFDRIGKDIQLLRCQRYYETGNLYGYTYSPIATQIRIADVWFKVDKRSTPTVTLNNIVYSSANVSSAFVEAPTTKRFGVAVQTSTTDAHWINADWIADSDF